MSRTRSASSPRRPTEALAPALFDKLLARDLPAGVFLNVNFPNCAAGGGRRRRRDHQGKFVHGLWIEERADGRGLPYYWLRFGRETAEMRPGTDMAAVSEKRISVTPLKLDLTAYEVRESLAKALA